jgi:hypothetical protein
MKQQNIVLSTSFVHFENNLTIIAETIKLAAETTFAYIQGLQEFGFRSQKLRQSARLNSPKNHCYKGTQQASR